MRLVIAVLDSRDSQAALRRLSEAGFGATQLASSGGFMRRGNATLLVGVDDERVEDVLSALKASTAGKDAPAGAGDAATLRGAAWVTRVADFRKV